MIYGNYAIKRLILSAARAVKERFTLRAGDWHEAIEVYQRSRPVYIKSDYSGGWLHPWQTSVKWSESRGQFLAEINAGFVNGEEVEVRIPRDLANETTLARAGDHDRVDAWLTDEPKIPLKPITMRAIGPDGSVIGTGANADGSEITLQYEPVPDFFAALGVGDTPEKKITQFGLIENVDFNDDKKVRKLLRAVEVTLTQDRLSTSAQWSQGAGVDGTVAQFDVIYQHAPSARQNAYVSLVRDFVPQTIPDPSDRITGNYQDDPFDRKHLATIYFLSPSGAKDGAEVDSSWTPYVRHRMFWNVNHATNRLAPPPETTVLTLNTGLAGGVADGIFNQILSANNDATDAAFEFISNNTLEGRFWTT